MRQVSHHADPIVEIDEHRVLLGDVFTAVHGGVYQASAFERMQDTACTRFVGWHLLIGATALATGGRVATREVRSFPRIPGLDFVEW